MSKKICPLCGRVYEGRPALSRTDGRTDICPECGTRQSLDALGLDSGERDEVLAVMRRYGAWGEGCKSFSTM